MEKESRQIKSTQQPKLFSIHRSENSKPGAKPAAIVVQVRMKQPVASPAKPILYKKADEFWVSNQGK